MDTAHCSDGEERVELVTNEDASGWNSVTKEIWMLLLELFFVKLKQ